MNDLRELVSNGQDAVEVIKQSINRGYRGFFEVKKYNNYNDRKKFAEGSKGLKSVWEKKENISNVAF